MLHTYKVAFRTHGIAVAPPHGATPAAPATAQGGPTVMGMTHSDTPAHRAAAAAVTSAVHPP